MIVVYPGTFDPITKGHLDIIERGCRLFEKLVVSVGVNTAKVPMFSCEERVQLIKELTKPYPNVEVTSFQGLVVEHAKKVGAQAILRGIRTFSDFEYEFQMALTNREIGSSIETIFILPRLEYSFISSHLIKEILSFGGDISPFVPPLVEKAMREKIRNDPRGI